MGISSRIALRLTATILCVAAAVWLALWYFIPTPPTSITIAAGTKDGAFEHIANRYKERLARHHITLNLRFGAVRDTVRQITDPKSGVAASNI
jgi:hypothetical protein